MKTYMVKYLGRQVVSIVTAMIAFDGGSDSKHQFLSTIPTALIPTEENRKELLARYESFHEQSVQMHRYFRQSFIQGILANVNRECSLVEGVVHDPVSVNKCDDNRYEEFFNYGRVNTVERAAPIIDLDCINVNPNSYKTVQVVLDNVLEQMKPTNRKYVVLVMDGSPYCLAVKLLRTTYTCSECEATVMEEALEEHKQGHAATSTCFARKYKKIVIRPGAGHIEINMVRNILAFFWTPILEPFAKLLGFKTEAALLYAKRGSDHHKSYNMLM